MKATPRRASLHGASCELAGCVLLIVGTLSAATAEPLVAIPFKLDGKLMLVETRINDSEPVTFIIDTGASHTVFDPKFAKQLGLAMEAAPPTTGTGSGDVQKSITKPVRMTLNGFDVDLPEPWVIDLSKAPLPAATVGLVGAELFKSHIVRINPISSTMSVFDPASAPEPKGESVPLIVDGDKLFVEAKLEVPAGKTVTHKLRIDTGSESSINDEVAQQSEEMRTSILGGGLGENFKSYSGVFTSAAIGPFTFKKFWGPAGPRPAIGMELLRRFVLTFDAPHGRLYIEPTSRIDEPVPTPPPES